MRYLESNLSSRLRNVPERNREYEKQREEERLRKFGCPIMRAERNFFETVSRLRREREEFYNEVKSQIGD